MRDNYQVADRQGVYELKGGRGRMVVGGEKVLQAVEEVAVPSWLSSDIEELLAPVLSTIYVVAGFPGDLGVQRRVSTIQNTRR